jgi:hypothetical protein
MKSSLIGNLFLIISTFLGLSLLGIDRQTTLANRATINKQSTKSSVEYRCVERNGNPSTIAYTNRGAIELIVWKNDYFAASGYTSKRRCQEVTSRFQQHHEAKNLRFISTGKLNNYNVICVAEKSGTCKIDGLLITLQHEDDPEQVLRDLFNLAARRSGGGITRTGSRSGSLKQIIDLDKFLAESSVINDTAATPTENLDSERFAPDGRDRTSANQSTSQEVEPNSTDDNSTNSDRTIIENPVTSGITLPNFLA